MKNTYFENLFWKFFFLNMTRDFIIIIITTTTTFKQGSQSFWLQILSRKGWAFIDPLIF